MSNEKVVPEIGMGCTAYLYSDRHAYTVAEIVDSRTVVVQRDNAECLTNYHQNEIQDWVITPDPEGKKVTVTLRKDGSWVERKVPTRGGVRYVFGYRREYYDPSF